MKSMSIFCMNKNFDVISIKDLFLFQPSKPPTHAPSPHTGWNSRSTVNPPSHTSPTPSPVGSIGSVDSQVSLGHPPPPISHIPHALPCRQYRLCRLPGKLRSTPPPPPKSLNSQPPISHIPHALPCRQYRLCGLPGKLRLGPSHLTHPPSPPL